MGIDVNSTLITPRFEQRPKYKVDDLSAAHHHVGCGLHAITAVTESAESCSKAPSRPTHTAKSKALILTLAFSPWQMKPMSFGVERGWQWMKRYSSLAKQGGANGLLPEGEAFLERLLFVGQY